MKNAAKNRTWPLVVVALAFGIATAVGVKSRYASIIDTAWIFVLYTGAAAALLIGILKFTNWFCAAKSEGGEARPGLEAGEACPEGGEACLDPQSQAVPGRKKAVSLFAAHKTFLILFGIAAIPFVLMLLANYPGVGSADSGDSIRQSLGEVSLSNHTTFFYTCLVMPFIKFGNAIGNVPFGFFLYALCQCMCMAAVVAFAANWFLRKGAPRKLVLAVFCFYVLNPVILRFGITMWKDIPFSMAVLLYVLTLADVAFSKGELFQNKKAIVRLAIFTFLVAMLRGNGTIVVALSTIALVIAYKDKARKVFAGVGVSVVLLSVLITGPLYTVLGVSPSPFQESVGILLQQVGYVINNNGEVSESALDTFSQIMEIEYWESDYDARTADGLKFGGHFNEEWLNENKIAFLGAWFETGLHNVPQYVKAWLANTQGYWDISPDIADRWVCMDGVSTFDDETGTNLLSQLTGLSVLESEFNDYSELRGLPLLYPFFNLACMFWIVLSIAALWLCRKKGRFAVITVPLLAVWLTLMIAAPDFCQFRYMFSFHMCLPVLLALACYDFWKPAGATKPGAISPHLPSS